MAKKQKITLKIIMIIMDAILMSKEYRYSLKTLKRIYRRCFNKFKLLRKKTITDIKY
jgi:thymidylate synthase ThyX